jgi:peptide chain release factor 1
VPPDAEDSCSDIVFEVSAGVGGQEAMLFARELFDMYCNYITHKNWDMQVAHLDLSDLGQLKLKHYTIFTAFSYKLELNCHRDIIFSTSYNIGKLILLFLWSDT